MLLQELPSKIGQRVLKSVYWADVDSPAAGRPRLRRVFARVARGVRTALDRRAHTPGPVEAKVQIVRREIMVHLPIGSEHRWGERVRVDLPVLVLEEGRAAMDGHLKNLSLSGAFLKSSHDLPIHALIGVRIEFPSPSAESSVVKARVLRKPGHGIGIEWCEFAPAVVKDLLRSPSGRYPR